MTSGPSLSPTSLAALRVLSRLEVLELDDATGVEPDLTQMLCSACPVLQHLVLGWAPVMTDQGLACLARRGLLRRLEAHGMLEAGPALWGELARSPVLEQLVISADRINPPYWMGPAPKRSLEGELTLMCPRLRHVHVVTSAIHQPVWTPDSAPRVVPFNADSMRQ
jgi:hypothetical protein